MSPIRAGWAERWRAASEPVPDAYEEASCAAAAESFLHPDRSEQRLGLESRARTGVQLAVIRPRLGRQDAVSVPHGSGHGFHAQAQDARQVTAKQHAGKGLLRAAQLLDAQAGEAIVPPEGEGLGEGKAIAPPRAHAKARLDAAELPAPARIEPRALVIVERDRLEDRRHLVLAASAEEGGPDAGGAARLTPRLAPEAQVEPDVVPPARCRGILVEADERGRLPRVG